MNRKCGNDFPYLEVDFLSIFKNFHVVHRCWHAKLCTFTNLLAFVAKCRGYRSGDNFHHLKIDNADIYRSGRIAHFSACKTVSIFMLYHKVHNFCLAALPCAVEKAQVGLSSMYSSR